MKAFVPLHRPRRGRILSSAEAPLGGRQPLFGQPDGLGNRRIGVEFAGVEEDRVTGGPKGRHLACRIAFIAGANIGEHFGFVREHSPLLELFEPAPGTDLRRGGDEQLHVRAWSDHRADIPTVEDGAPLLCGEGALPL